MRSTVFFAAGVAATLAATAPGQEVSEDEVLARITAAHPAMAALDAGRARAQAERDIAAVLANPELAAAYESPSDLATQIDVTVAWAPPLDGRRRLAVAAAEAGLTAAARLVESGRLRARGEARAAFALWWAATAEHGLLEAHWAHLAVLAERARLRAAGGEESGLAARRLAAEAAQAAADAAAAHAAAARARATLALWAPELPALARPLPPPLPPDPPPLDASGRPDLAALAAALRQAEHDAELSARIVRFPELTAGWQRLEQGGVRHSGLLGGIRWSVPLAGQKRAGRTRGEATLAAARAELSLATARATAELAGEVEALSALRAAAAAAADAEADAERMVTAAVASFSLGEASLTDTLDTLRSALGARLRAVEAHAAVLASHRALEQASGQALPLGGGQ